MLPLFLYIQATGSNKTVMDNHKDTRWKQRFQNFQKAFKLLEKAVKIEKLTEIERGGLIQFFEVTFELSWKILKDYLEVQGFIVKSPRESIKMAIQNEIIQNGYLWMDALEDRNLTTHIYDEEIIKTISHKIINEYYPAIEQLYSFFKVQYESR